MIATMGGGPLLGVLQPHSSCGIEDHVLTALGKKNYRLLYFLTELKMNFLIN
jgi:hypothetical protein